VTKIWLVARREFIAAVFNRGFVIGLLMMPALLALFAVLGPRIFMPRPVHVTGDIAVIDPTGRILPALRTSLAAETLAAHRERDGRRLLAGAPPMARNMPGARPMLDAMLGADAVIRVVDPPAGPQPAIENGKVWLRADSPSARHLALIVIGDHAIAPGDQAESDYELFVPSALDMRVLDVIHDGVREAIVTVRAAEHGVDRERIEALMRVRRPSAVTVAKDVERSAGGFNIVLPLVMAGLMVVGVMVGGQTLLTSTIEEKSSRVIEVLLSAISPFELMAGKILGQLAVSLLVLVVYCGLGVALLVSFAMLGLLDPLLVLYMFVFFFITYVFFGAVFATAGAAVNDMKEAQTLMGPVMLLLMGPWIVAFPIMREPESTMAVVLSFVPPVNAFVMMLRLASTNPPPAWQALLSIAIGVASSVLAIWFASKVFRIGLLMHGKPPNLATLWRWARAA